MQAESYDHGTNSPIGSDLITGPSFHLLIENPSRRNNIGPILRCASAFGVESVILVGHSQYSCHGSHGANKHVHVIAFPTFIQAVEYIRKPIALGGCGVNTIIGCLGASSGNDAFQNCTVVEQDTNLVTIEKISQREKKTTATIYPPSYPIHLRPFTSDGYVCFSFSKMDALPKQQASLCDYFIHVPYLPNASLVDTKCHLIDAQTSLSIILHHFTAWVKKSARSFSGQKFHVTERKQKNLKPEVRAQIHTQRELQRVTQIHLHDEAVSAESLDFLFGG